MLPGRQRGFTFVELMVTVAIVALLGSIAAYSLLKGRRRLNLERATLALKGLLEQARAASAVAGSRVGTNRLAYGNGCTNEATASPTDPTQWQLWVRVNGNTIEIPERVEDSGNDTVTVLCRTFDVAQATKNLGQITRPAAPLTFAFAPSGRLVLRANPGPYVYIQLENPNDTKRFGLRVFPSGVVCSSSVETGPPWCDAP